MAQQAELLDVKEPKKLNQHVRMALTHLNKRLAMTREIEGLDAAILALE